MQYSGRSSAFENRFLPLCFFTALFWRFSDKEIGTEENLCPDPLKKKMKIRKKDIAPLLSAFPEIQRMQARALSESD